MSDPSSRRPSSADTPVEPASSAMSPVHQVLWRRAKSIRAFDRGEDLILVGQSGAVHQLFDVSAGLARELLWFAARPHTRAELEAHLCARAGVEALPDAVMSPLYALLEGSGLLRRCDEPESVLEPPSVASLPRGLRVLVCATGAVASMHLPSLVSRLQQAGCDVQVAASACGLRFVSQEALEALTHRPVVSSMWSDEPAAPVPHLVLAGWADIVLLYPTTATTLSRIATGDCSALIPAVAIATRAPVLIAPSMNVAMYEAPSVQRNLQQLRDDGFCLVHPTLGVELAEPPTSREPILGPAPGHGVILSLLRVLHVIEQASREEASTDPAPPLSEPAHIRDAPGVAEASSSPQRPEEATAPQAPRGREEWDQLYQGTPRDALPWFTTDADADVMEALALIQRPARVLDVGTGLGQVAMAAARMGFHVVATDVSHVALVYAQAEASGAPVIWLQDNITASRLVGPFECLIDRGCFHLLSAADVDAYVDTVIRLTEPGARLLIKLHHPDEPRELGTHRYTAEALAARLQPHFVLKEAEESVMPGPTPPHPKALLCVFARVGDS